MDASTAQWGSPDFFSVKSNGGKDIAAKWLKTPVGNYVIDPVTNKPYIVPADYDPANTISKYRQAAADANSGGVGSSPSVVQAMKAGALVDGFFPAWPGSADDLQRSYNGYIGQKMVVWLVAVQTLTL